MNSVAIQSRIRDLQLLRHTLEERIDSLEAEATAAGNAGRMGRYMDIRQRLRTLHNHMIVVRMDLARMQHVEPPLPSRRQSELVER